MNWDKLTIAQRCQWALENAKAGRPEYVETYFCLPLLGGSKYKTKLMLKRELRKIAKEGGAKIIRFKIPQKSRFFAKLSSFEAKFPDKDGLFWLGAFGVLK